MQGLKNLIPKGVLSNENYDILKKRSDQYKKSIHTFTSHIHQMAQVYIDYYSLLEDNIKETMIELQHQKEPNCCFFSDLILLFCNLNGQLQKFIEKASRGEESLQQLSNLFLSDFDSLVEAFESKGKEYIELQQKILNLAKKYFSVYRDMTAKIQAYKTSFMDVKLIYNNEEKVRRYSDCLQTYKQIQESAKLLQDKASQLNNSKIAVINSYKILQKQLSNFTIAFASRYIQELKKFFEHLFEYVNNQLQIFIDKLGQLQKSELKSFLQLEFNLSFQNIISVEVDPSRCNIFPCFLVYREKLTEEGKYKFKRCIFNYYNEISQKIQKRKKISKKMLEFTIRFLRDLQKSLAEGIREILRSFDKMRKKIGEVFGSRWISFYKIIAAVFENCIENTGRLLLKANSLVRNLENYVGQESNLMSDFMKELKIFTENNLPRKFFRKFSHSSEIKQEEISKEQMLTSQQQIMMVSEMLMNLISRYQPTANVIYLQTKKAYFDLAHHGKQSLSQYFIFFNEIQTTYYEEEQYAKSYKIFQDQLAELVKRDVEFFGKLEFSIILKETSKITFDDELNKLEGFKKLKKPKEFEEIDKMTEKSKAADSQSISQQMSEASKNKEYFIGGSHSQHAEFLLKRIALEPCQKYLKSYSCSLSDIIILAGRIFITSHRICFHSKFNSKNIFFGNTFIEIPSQDIKKVQRRPMNFLSDHAIAITTIHGQVVFRSFFSRDDCYNLIRKTFEINQEEIFFQESDRQSNLSEEEKVEFQDDMKEVTAQQRELKIVKDIKEFDYQSINEEVFTSLGLTVVKFLKVFQVDHQVVINHTHFPSFLYYFKDLTGNKDITIEPWNPSLSDCLNVINIKEGSPEIFQRTITAIAPLPPSNIPFMPKTSMTTEKQTMHLISNGKVIIESVVTSSGVPYSDTFEVRLKRVIQTSGENSVKVSCFMFLNFLQSVIVQSTIQSKSFETTKQSILNQNFEKKSYLKVLQKKIVKGGKRESPEQKIKEQEEQIEQLQNKLKQLREEQKQVHSKLLRQQEKAKNLKIIVLVLATLVLGELLLLLS